VDRARDDRPLNRGEQVREPDGPIEAGLEGELEDDLVQLVGRTPGIFPDGPIRQGR
jgi:hypothetical protein